MSGITLESSILLTLAGRFYRIKVCHGLSRLLVKSWVCQPNLSYTYVLKHDINRSLKKPLRLLNTATLIRWSRNPSGWCQEYIEPLHSMHLKFTCGEVYKEGSIPLQ
jgi:hypothetical protein